MSKTFRQYGIFLIVPGIVLACSVLLKVAAGPYWLDPNMEGPYASLSNGLDMLKGNVPDDITHPAAPMQILCCVICRLFNMGRSTQDAIRNVLTSPEFYLHIVFVVLVLFSFFTSVAVAVYVFRKTNDKLAALLLQLPAMSFLTVKIYATIEPVIPIVANVGSETLLVSLINLFNMCFLMNFFAKTIKEEYVSILLWGFVCGWGVAEKLTFIPLLVVPLIVLSWKNRFLFAAVFAASFVLWTLPILSKYPLLWVMIKNYSMPQGGQGCGRACIQGYCLNWKNIIVEYWVFAGIVFAAILSVLWKLMARKWDKASFFLVAVSLGVLLQIAVVAKHPGPQYLVPGLGLLSSLWALFYLQGPSRKILGRQITVAFILVFILAGTWQAREYRSNLERLTRDIISFDQDVHAKYQNCTFVNYYRSTGKEFALYLGDAWNGSPQLMKEKYQVYPKSFFLIEVGWGNRIVSFKDRVMSDDLLAQSSCVLFQGDGLYGDLDTDLQGSPLSVRLLEKGRMERIYLLTGTTEKQAALMLVAAAHFIDAGDYEKALMCAVQAKTLHYQPQKDVDGLIHYIAPYVQH